MPVVVAAVIGFAIGWAWYSDMLFGKSWRREMGVTDQQMQEAKAKGFKGMQKQMALGFVSALVMSYVLANFIQTASATTVMSAMILAVWAWVGFIATVMLGQVLWEEKSWKLYSINAGYYLVSILVMAGILVSLM